MKNRNTRLGRWGSLLVLMIAALVFAVSPVRHAAAEPITLKAVAFLPKNISSVTGLQMFTERVNKESNGELVIKYLGGPEVIPPPALMEAVRTGRIDIAVQSAERFMDTVPETGFIHLSQHTPLEERQKGVFEWISKHLKEKMNVQYLCRINYGAGFYTHTNFPAGKVEDFAGKRIAARAQCFDFIRALGATPVDVGQGDWFAAVENRIVDGYNIPLASVIGWGMTKITKHTIDHVVYQPSNVLLMVNQKKWESLPPKLQKLMFDVAAKLEPDIGVYQDKVTAEARKKMEEGGVKFIKFSPDEAKKYVGLSISSVWEAGKKKLSPESFAETKKLLSD